jgi:hypothetical protein
MPLGGVKRRDSAFDCRACVLAGGFTVCRLFRLLGRLRCLRAAPVLCAVLFRLAAFLLACLLACLICPPLGVGAFPVAPFLLCVRCLWFHDFVNGRRRLRGCSSSLSTTGARHSSKPSHSSAINATASKIFTATTARHSLLRKRRAMSFEEKKRRAAPCGNCAPNVRPSVRLTFCRLLCCCLLAALAWHCRLAGNIPSRIQASSPIRLQAAAALRLPLAAPETLAAKAKCSAELGAPDAPDTTAAVRHCPAASAKPSAELGG